MKRIKELSNAAYAAGWDEAQGIFIRDKIPADKLDELQVRIATNLTTREVYQKGLERDLGALLEACRHILAADGDYPRVEDWRIDQDRLREAVGRFNG